MGQAAAVHAVPQRVLRPSPLAVQRYIVRHGRRTCIGAARRAQVVPPAASKFNLGLGGFGPSDGVNMHSTHTVHKTRTLMRRGRVRAQVQAQRRAQRRAQAPVLEQPDPRHLQGP